MDFTAFKKIGLGAVCALGLVASSAHAATYTFDFTQSSTGGWRYSSSVDSTDETRSVGISGARFTDDGTVIEGDSAVATWAGHGLGVCGDLKTGYYGGHYCNDHNHQVDGKYHNDLAVFDFGSLMTLDKIEFGYVNDDKEYVFEKVWRCTKWKRNGKCRRGYYVTKKVEVGTIAESFELFADDDGILKFVQSNAIPDTGDDTVESVAFMNLVASDRFGIGALADHDAFKIRSIMVSDYVPNPGPDGAVPLPASSLLLLGGLGGMAAMRRRRKSA